METVIDTELQQVVVIEKPNGTLIVARVINIQGGEGELGAFFSFANPVTKTITPFRDHAMPYEPTQKGILANDFGPEREPDGTPGHQILGMLPYDKTRSDILFTKFSLSDLEPFE